MLAIHCISPTVASRPCWIAGSATLITDASMNATLEPRIVPASTQRLACDTHPGVSGAPRNTPVSDGGHVRLSTGSEPDDAEGAFDLVAAVQVEKQCRHLVEQRRNGEAARIDRAQVGHVPDQTRDDG